MIVAKGVDLTAELITATARRITLKTFVLLGTKLETYLRWKVDILNALVYSKLELILNEAAGSKGFE